MTDSRILRPGLGERMSDWVATHPSGVLGRAAALRYGIPRWGDRRDVSTVRAAKCRVLITPANYAGQASHWAQALEAAETDLAACTLAVESSFAYPSDAKVARRVFQNSRSWQHAQLKAARGFSHLLVESLIPPFGRLAGRDMRRQLALLGSATSTAFLCHGSEVRHPYETAYSSPQAYRLATRVTARNRALLDELGRPVFVSTPDLLEDLPSAKWVPVVIDATPWKAAEHRDRGGPLRVVHAPSSAAVKGTASITPVMTRMHEAGAVEYAAVSGVPHAEMPQVYAGADVVLDQFTLGIYGVAACEAMAAGKVVVSHVRASVRERVRDVTGRDLPIVEATPDSLEDVLDGLRGRPEEHERLAHEGRSFVAAVHDGRLSAQALLDGWIR